MSTIRNYNIFGIRYFSCNNIGKLDAFLISGDYNKKFDQSVKEFIDKDFYEQVPSHQKLLNIKRPNQIKRTKSVLLPN